MSKQRFQHGDYQSPTIDRLDIEVEAGFASSIGNGGYDDDGTFGGDGSGSGIFGAGHDDDGFFE